MAGYHSIRNVRTIEMASNNQFRKNPIETQDILEPEGAGVHRLGTFLKNKVLKTAITFAAAIVSGFGSASFGKRGMIFAVGILALTLGATSCWKMTGVGGDTDTNMDVDTDVDADSDSGEMKDDVDADSDSGEMKEGLAWAKRAGGSSLEEGKDMVALTDGSAIVTGCFGETMVFGEGELNETILVSRGPKDLFVAKYNPDGTLEWAKGAGGVNYDRGECVDALEDGTLIVAGRVGGTIIFGEGEENEITLNPEGEEDAFIAKYTSDGTLTWVKSVGGTNGDSAFGISMLAGGSSIITGRFSGEVLFGEGEENETTLNTTDGSAAVIAKYNSDGTLAWAKNSGGAMALSVDTFKDSSSVIVGDFGKSTTFEAGEENETVLSSDGVNGVFIAKYNPDGTLAWAKKVGSGTDYIYLREVVTSGDGSFTTGYFFGDIVFAEGESAEATLHSEGEEDIFIAKHNSDGTLAWVRRIGETGDDQGKSISSLDGSVFLTGHFSQEVIFGEGEKNETILVSGGARDIFVAKYDPNGNLAHAMQIGGTGNNSGQAIALLEDAVFLAGSLSNTVVFGEGELNETSLTSAGGIDIFITKYWKE